MPLAIRRRSLLGSALFCTLFSIATGARAHYPDNPHPTRGAVSSGRQGRRHLATTQSVKDNPHVKVLAYTGRPGSARLLPGVETFAEQGIPNMVFHSSHGVAVRTGSAEPVRERLAAAAREGGVAPQ